jgi:hypothetical protein
VLGEETRKLRYELKDLKEELWQIILVIDCCRCELGSIENQPCQFGGDPRFCKENRRQERE